MSLPKMWINQHAGEQFEVVDFYITPELDLLVRVHKNESPATAAPSQQANTE